MLIHYSPPSAFLQNYILINIHYPHTIFLLFINYIFFKIYFFICWTIPKNIFTSNSESNHIIYMYMSIAIACGVEICIERQPYKSDTRENRWRIKSKLTYHCSFIHQWSSHGVCSICNVIPLCTLSVTLSITVHHQPFNKIIYTLINIHYP